MQQLKLNDVNYDQTIYKNKFICQIWKKQLTDNLLNFNTFFRLKSQQQQTSL